MPREPKKSKNRGIQASVDTPPKGVISFGVDNSKTDGDYEAQKFSVGFEFYREDLCDIKTLDKSPLRKVLENSKKICQHTSFYELTRNGGFTISPVYNSNHYKVYYKGLAPDIEVKEYDAGSNERAFFFVDNSPSRKIIQMIAITNAHTEDKKTKK